MENEELFVIRGEHMLSGDIPVRGAKNDALSLMAASLLFKEPVTLSNIPDILDIERMTAMLSGIGIRIGRNRDTRMITIHAPAITSCELPKKESQKLRASAMLIGPLLARFGEIRLPHPGGCVIGKRPIDYFIKGFEALGAHISQEDGGYRFVLPENTGGEILLPFPSVTATETFICAAVLAKGKTVIKNAAQEPEIANLIQFLQEGGADISGKGSGTIIVDGTQNTLLSRSQKEPFRVIPDRIEAGSFAVLGALLGRTLRITDCNPGHLEQCIFMLKQAGVFVTAGTDWIEIKKADELHAVDIKTAPYPGFPTDLQAPFGILLTQAKGKALIFETVFEARLGYLEDIKQMGADVTICDPQRAIIVGPSVLRGKNLKSPDLRAGLAFIIAGLVAKGETRVHNIYQIDRGYEKIEERLRAVGADIKRV